MLTLYIVPPAFRLPSIDPECLAALTYMKAILPKDEWEVVIDTNAVGNGASGDWSHLPALSDGVGQVHGYLDIVQRLKRYLQESWRRSVSDNSVSAEDLWLINNIRHRLSPLFSLLFYTSSDNYVSTVRPAFSKALPFPSSWILPANHRRGQVESVRLANIDITSSQLSAVAGSLEDKSKASDSETSALRRDPLNDDDLLRSQPLRKIPKENSTSAVIEVYRSLKSLVDDALLVYKSEGDAEALLSSGASDLQKHLLFAHLGLALAAASKDMPHPWLTSFVQEGHPELIRGTLAWLSKEWSWTTDQSNPDYPALLNWNEGKQNSEGKLASTLSGMAQLSGLDRLYVPAILYSRKVEGLSDETTVFRKSEPQGRPLGHEVDPIWLGVTGATVCWLAFKAWQEGF